MRRVCASRAFGVAAAAHVLPMRMYSKSAVGAGPVAFITWFMNSAINPSDRLLQPLFNTVSVAIGTS